MDQNQNGIKTWQWVVTVVVIIVLIIIGIMVFGRKGAEAPVVTPGEQASTTPVSTVSQIVMADQYPGNVVYVSSVQMANPGWVVIHKNASGQPGAVIGSAYVAAGISPVKITLSQPMVDGMTYYAMLHSDNGDQKFDITVDQPLTDASGNIIMKVFKASVSAGAEIKG